MKKKDLINTIQRAYDVKPSEKGKAFIQEYESRGSRNLNVQSLERSPENRSLNVQGVHQSRELRLLDVLKMELKQANWLCMCLMTLVLSVAVCLCDKYPRVAWGYGAMMPLFVLLGVISFGRSQRFGMFELETASRFSKNFLKMVRVFLAGVFSTIALLTGSVVMYFYLKIDVAFVIMLTMIPFLITAYTSLLLIRHWHSPHNIYGCVAIAVACAILPLFQNIKSLLAVVPLWGAIVLAVILIAATGKEVVSFIKIESEEPTWN